MFITFVVDTSGSMNQKTANGMSLLDCSKAAIEHFIKIRSKDSSIRSDRFFLLTTEESSHSVKSGWRDHFNSFLNELKNLHSNDLSNLPTSICRAFDLLNQFRTQTLIDNYGMGRNPWFVEPAIVVLLTDGGPMITSNSSATGSNSVGLVDQFQVPRSTIPFAELTNEAYRWDQRLYSILMRFSGVSCPHQQTGSGSSSTAASSTTASTASDTMASVCDGTGGKLQIATNMKQMIAHIESLIQKLTNGVLVSFDPILHHSIPHPPPTSPHKMLYVRPGQNGFWPIPESFYPDLNSPTFPPRSTHPLIRYSLFDCDSNIPENFPFDKYEIESCPATQYLLANKLNCVQTFVYNSQSIPGQGEPFGYLRPSSNGQTVNLFVFPYNYPRLWVLLDELVNHLKLAPSPKWKQEFESYLLSIPPYYITPMRNAFKRYCTLNLVPDNIDIQFTNYMNNIAKKLKSQSVQQQQQQQQKSSSLDSKQQQLQQQQQQSKSISTNLSSFNKDYNTSPYNRSLFSNRSIHKILENGGGAFDSLSGVPDTDDNDASESFDDIQQTTTNFQQSGVFLHKNVFDIPRDGLLSQIDRMKHHLFKKKQDEEESKYHVPISQMGNYHETLNKRETLRDIDEDKKPNHPLFGNPYRKDKGQRLDVSIDEAEDSDIEGANVKKGPPKRRRVSKLPPPIKIAPKPTLPNTPPATTSTSPLPTTNTGATSTVTQSPPLQLPALTPTLQQVATASAGVSVPVNNVPSQPSIVPSSPQTLQQPVTSPPINNNVSPVLLSTSNIIPPISPPQPSTTASVSLPTSTIPTLASSSPSTTTSQNNKISPPPTHPMSTHAPSNIVIPMVGAAGNNLIPSPTSPPPDFTKKLSNPLPVNNDKLLYSIKKEIRRPTKNNIDLIISSIQSIGGTGAEVNSIIRKQIKPLAEEYKKYSLLLRIDALLENN